MLELHNIHVMFIILHFTIMKFSVLSFAAHTVFPFAAHFASLIMFAIIAASLLTELFLFIPNYP